MAPPQAAYIHVPFCRRRCGYCNFTVAAGREDLIDLFLVALERELQQLQQPRPVETLFLGGGTPTHLAPRQLERLFEIVKRWFPLSEHGEFSIEANPGDLVAEKIAILADAGVNRLSLGVQSFDDAKLTSAGTRSSARHDRPGAGGLPQSVRVDFYGLDFRRPR
jgi:oxygen-independent coproporphyrinogen III oxidase